jgi:hypothetical protein
MTCRSPNYTVTAVAVDAVTISWRADGYPRVQQVAWRDLRDADRG